VLYFNSCSQTLSHSDKSELCGHNQCCHCNDLKIYEDEEEVEEYDDEPESDDNDADKLEQHGDISNELPQPPNEDLSGVSYSLL
jgi:hypothetical protein